VRLGCTHSSLESTREDRRVATPDGPAPEPGATPVAELDLERMRADVARSLDEPAEGIADTDDLLDRGLDSIRLMSLVESWRGEGAEVSFVDLAEEPTLQAWARLLTRS
jgi:aryl carrier-like protein